jgi:hypothetical protein
LHTLAQDQDRRVRAGVAGNRQTPAKVLQALAQDQDPDVQWIATLVQKLLTEVSGSFREQEW